MRTHHRIATCFMIGFILCGTALTLSLIYLRWHIRDLWECIHTYATFDALDLDLFTYPPTYADTKLAAQSPQLAPKILHQIMLHEEHHNTTLSKYTTARQSCTSLHPTWDHKLWTNNNATIFVVTNYPHILPHYLSYPQPIQRTNILRYLLLHHFGGVYLDADITCRAPLGPLLHTPFLTPAAHPAGINNAFILSRAQHPFLTSLIARIPSRNLPWPLPYVENMLSTGCMFFSNAWMAYMRRRDGLDSQDRVFVLADERGRLGAHLLRGRTVTPLFEHGGASSWHSWDADLIRFLDVAGKPLMISAAACLAAIAGVGCLVVMRRKRGLVRRRGRKGADVEKKRGGSKTRVM
ncbi:hypothetical protein WHR41_04746 [Cladosporium halotolerans]|uniref:Glycosyltransferase family 32 protein n=1 Tax=Cladosporium halotolerans TaxID=1052096 RepID=A0AB34KM71_9PEZI